MFRRGLRNVIRSVGRDVNGHAAVVWVDASSLAEEVVITTPEGRAIEDASWLRRDESSHINISELDAAVRGFNLAVA